MRKKMVIIALLLVIATLVSTSCSVSLTITTTSAPTSVITPTPTLTILPSITLTTTSAPSAVTSVTASVDPTTYSGPVPKTFTFSAVITVNGPCTVTYKWERSDGGIGPTETITFNAAGSQTVTYDWMSISKSPYAGWGRIHILTPNDMTSNKANFWISSL